MVDFNGTVTNGDAIVLDNNPALTGSLIITTDYNNGGNLTGTAQINKQVIGR